MSYTRVVVAGSRSFGQDAYSDVEDAIEDSGFDPDVIVSGGAKGVDELGEQYGKNNAIPIHIIPADWETHGKSAGHKRNADMAEYGDALVAVWDGDSPGTKSMISKMHATGKPVYVSIPSLNKVKTVNYE